VTTTVQIANECNFLVCQNKLEEREANSTRRKRTHDVRNENLKVPILLHLSLQVQVWECVTNRLCERWPLLSGGEVKRVEVLIASKVGARRWSGVPACRNGS